MLVSMVAAERTGENDIYQTENKTMKIELSSLTKGTWERCKINICMNSVLRKQHFADIRDGSGGQMNPFFPKCTISPVFDLSV